MTRASGGGPPGRLVARAPGSPLGPGGEFDRIRAIWRRLGPRASGLGDDCALVTVGGERLAVTGDLAIEGVHFRAGWLSHYEIGWRAGTAALSDLAAVAAEPEGVLVSLGVPEEWPEQLVAEVMEGIDAVAEGFGAGMWGGDLVRSDRAVVDVVAVGRAPHPVLRSGAEPGESLWVTGALGGPLAALRAFEAGREPEASARERFASPRPRVAEAAWLREQGATAMIDLSDGLVGDAGHLAAASKAALVLEAERVPVHGAARAADALVSGEEYELLVTLPDGVDPAAAFREAFDLPLTPVGFVRAGEGVELREGGRPVKLPEGFRHFG